jgi:hypothetical protein
VRIRRITNHSLQAIAEASLIAMLVIGLMAGTAFAARGGGHTSSTSGITISVPDGVFGGTATATITGAPSTEWFYVKCIQDGGTALLDWERIDAAGHSYSQLGPTGSWASGAATCTGQAGHFDRRSRWQTDASTTFNVSG